MSAIVDADGHVFEPAEVWVERMDAKRWGDWIPRYVAEDHDGNESWYVGGVRRFAGTGIFGCGVGLDPEELVSRKWRYTEGHAAGWDPRERVRVLDDEGIDVTVLYPTMGLLFGPLDPIPAIQDPQFVLACQRAYNEWVAEYCRAAPDRLQAMAVVPIQDVDLAVGEARRAIEDLGLCGIMLRSSTPSTAQPFNHPAFDPLWSLCQDLDVPIALHPATHVDFANAVRVFDLINREANVSVNNRGTDEMHGGGAISHAVGAPVDAIVSLGRLLMGGVCERFPHLRFLVLEAGGGWLPAVLHAMDEEVHARPNERRWLSMLPSEYFRRQCWISFGPDDPTLVPTVEQLGDDRILWATDFPHLDGAYPGAVKSLDETLSGLAPESRARVAGLNALEAYGLRAPAST
jgi:predicted TIM-barrel fold metal-dependent hydrolase